MTYEYYDESKITGEEWATALTLMGFGSLIVFSIAYFIFLLVELL